MECLFEGVQDWGLIQIRVQPWGIETLPPNVFPPELLTSAPFEEMNHLIQRIKGSLGTRSMNLSGGVFLWLISTASL